MWKLTALIAVAVIACLAPFWLFGLKMVGPMIVGSFLDWVDCD